MHRLRTKFAVVSSLLLALALGACEHGTGLEPEVSLDAQERVEAPRMAVVEDARGNEYTLVRGRIPSDVPTLSVFNLIGLGGGSLHLAGHHLWIPGGAVLEPTLFRMSAITNGYVEVELRATIVRKLLGFLWRVINIVIDVGDDGFNEPVTLELSYAWASNVEDPSDLVILHVRDNGTVVPVPTEVDENRKVIRAQLDHFSRYCMAMN